MESNFRPEEFRITRHARERLDQRGFALTTLFAVLRSPESVYESKKFPGQLRVNGEGMCAAVDPVKKTVITVFFNTQLDPNWKK